MKLKQVSKVIAIVICLLMCVTAIPMTSHASIPGWADNNVVYDGKTFGTNGYYNVISKKDYVLVPGAAVESEMVLNNAAGTRRQVIHVIEVDPSNPDVSIVPGYNQIDKDMTPNENGQNPNWSHKELTDMAAYYENTLGYNIVGGMNTDLYYDTYAPRVLVYNGKDIGLKRKGVVATYKDVIDKETGEPVIDPETGNTVQEPATYHVAKSPTSSVLYVFKDAEGNISCDVKAYVEKEFDAYLESGELLHAVGVSFGMVVKDGELVKKTEERTSAAAARSMVGVKEDGTLVICMNDGRGANNSVGFCDYEEGEAMLALGCKWAANCDGGGSSTFLTKRAGEDDFTMRSVPCDGAQRPTAHGIFVASNVAPTGVLNNVNVTSDYDYFAPNTEYTFGAEAIDTHGYAMDMPRDAEWALSDSSFGTIKDGKFVSNGKKGEVAVQVLSDGKVVGSKSITVADPEVFKLSATSTVVPYSTADKVRTIKIPIVAMTGEANVYVDNNAVAVSLSNENAGKLDGFSFTATDDTSIEGVDVTVKYGESEALTYAIEFGLGSQVIYDFEDGDKAGFMGYEEAKKWSKENDIKNTLVGSEPLAGQFNEYLSSTTAVVTEEEGGQVRNGKYALAWTLDNTDAAFASWSYNVLFNTGETKVLRDVANDKKAVTLGMWLYIPENAFPAAGKGLAFQSQLYAPATGGGYSCKQDHFTFTSAATGKQTNLNSATNADIPESRWVYASINIAGYDYLSTPVATDTSNSRSPSFIRTYVKPDTADKVTFYIDDITLDYSSAVDDRVLPTITAPTYSTSDTAIALENGAAINGNKIAFSATVADNAALDRTSGKIFVDGIEVNANIAGSTLSSKEDVDLIAGAHTVSFEVKDELGNPARLTRTFTVSGDGAITLSGHNDSDATPKAQSVYYVDIKAADPADVTKLVTKLKLHNANTWETKGAVVANGFKATYDYNKVSELLTVTVEAEDASKIAADENTIVSIPVRVWTYDRYNYVTETYYSPAEFTGNKPVVNIECDVVYGEATLGKTTSSFGGSINVATELTTISSPYHIHDAELKVLNKEATAKEEGYENRTYCETCKSVVDWGTKVERLNHNYAIEDSQFVCQDEGCNDVYKSGTGIFEMNGKLYYSINDELKTGWQDTEDGYCYASTSNYEVATGNKTINGVTYTFDDNGVLTKGEWVNNEKGIRYSYGPGYYTRMWVDIDGNSYYFGRDSYAYIGTRFVKDNPDTDPVWYIFNENGATDKNIHPADGFYEYNNDLYYVINGKTQFGLQKINNDYYYFDAGSGFDRVGYAVKDKDHYVKNTNDLTFEDGTKIPSRTYHFDAEGKMVIRNGVVDGIYYENSKPIEYKGLVYQDGYFYYVNEGGKVVKDRDYFVKTTNDLTFEDGTKIPSRIYHFDAEGKMAIRNGVVDGIYYENSKPIAYKGLVYQDGYFYYVNDGGKVIKDRDYFAKTTNDLTFEDGTKVSSKMYHFDEDGKMVVESNIIKAILAKLKN